MTTYAVAVAATESSEGGGVDVALCRVYGRRVLSISKPKRETST
jgi:hypothetical protein